MDIRDLGGAHEPECSISRLRHTVFEREIFSQRIAKSHEHAALDLPLYGDRIYYLAGIMSRIHFFHPSVIVQDHYMGGESVCHMALWIWHVSS